MSRYFLKTSKIHRRQRYEDKELGAKTGTVVVGHRVLFITTSMSVCFVLFFIAVSKLLSSAGFVCCVYRRNLSVWI